MEAELVKGVRWELGRRTLLVIQRSMRRKSKSAQKSKSRRRGRTKLVKMKILNVIERGGEGCGEYQLCKEGGGLFKSYKIEGGIAGGSLCGGCSSQW